MNDGILKIAPGIGVDITPVSRFLPFENDRENPFLKKVFFESECEYCFSYKNPGVHLAGFFALKEAVSKALGVTQYPFAQIEIKHDLDGAPIAFYNGQKLSVRVSISHTDELAIGIAAL